MDSSKVSVVVRVRELNDAELRSGASHAITVHPETNQIQAQLKDKTFNFDKVIPEDAEQSDVYTAVQGLTQKFIEGFNATILAYGQTGAGKTFTMGSNFSPREDAKANGIIPRLVEDVLGIIGSMASTTRCTLTISYLEIYNEHVKDLLIKGEAPAKGYQLQKDDHGNYMVAGLTEVAVASLDDVAKSLDHGARLRSTASTQMNAHSSRSHAVITLRLDQEPIVDVGEGGDAEGGAGSEEAAPAMKKSSLFRLVDLAGSERAKKTGAEGDRLREANNINQSLSTLGKCIMALAAKEKHIPFRDSKLTQLLMNSLGGNSATLMIACVSPADTNFEETLQTLRYADAASCIENRPVVNTDPTASLNVKLRNCIQELKSELGRLYARGVDVSPHILTTYSIAALGAQPSYYAPAPVLLPSTAGFKQSAPTVPVPTAEYAQLKGELARYKELAEKLEIDQAETRIHLREATRVIDSMQALMQDNMRMKKQVEAWRAKFESGKEKGEDESEAFGSLLEDDVIPVEEPDDETDASTADQVSVEGEGEEGEHDADKVRYMKTQMEAQKRIESIQQILHWKEALFRQTEITQEQYKAQTAKFESETKLKEEEIVKLQLKLDMLTHEPASGRTQAKGAPADAASVRQKDKELREVKKQLADLTAVVANAKRDQRVRDHELAKHMTLKEEIELHKKEKVALEKRMREEAKKYADERRERELERARAIKRERLMKLELAKKDDQITKQLAALATHRQREKRAQEMADCYRGKKDQAETVRQRRGRPTKEAPADAAQPTTGMLRRALSQPHLSIFKDKEALDAGEDIMKDLALSGDVFAEASFGPHGHTWDEGFDVRVATALGEACVAKVNAGGERFCSEAVRKCISRMVSLRIQRLYLQKRARELMAERNSLMQTHGGQEEAHRQVAGLTLALGSIQSAMAALSEKETKDGVAKDEWISRVERAGGNTRSLLRWFISIVLRLLISKEHGGNSVELAEAQRVIAALKSDIETANSKYQEESMQREFNWTQAELELRQTISNLKNDAAKGLLCSLRESEEGEEASQDNRNLMRMLEETTAELERSRAQEEAMLAAREEAHNKEKQMLTQISFLKRKVARLEEAAPPAPELPINVDAITESLPFVTTFTDGKCDRDSVGSESSGDGAWDDDAMLTEIMSACEAIGAQAVKFDVAPPAPLQLSALPRFEDKPQRTKSFYSAKAKDAPGASFKYPAFGSTVSRCIPEGAKAPPPLCVPPPQTPSAANTPLPTPVATPAHGLPFPPLIGPTTILKPAPAPGLTARRGSVSVYDRLASTHTDSSRAKDRTVKPEPAPTASRRSSIDGGVRGREEAKKEGVAIGALIGALPEAGLDVSPLSSPLCEEDPFAFMVGHASEEEQENEGYATRAGDVATKKRSPLPKQEAAVLADLQSPTIRKRQRVRS